MTEKRSGWYQETALSQCYEIAVGRHFIPRRLINWFWRTTTRFRLVEYGYEKTASTSTLDGLFVRDYLSQTTFNLFEGAVRFAQSFERNEAKYDRFFVSVGKSDRRTADIRDPKQRSSGAGRGLRDSDGGSDDWSSDWCDGMHSWYSEMMDRD